MFLLGPDGCAYVVLDGANHSSHEFQFDHVPTGREMAMCHMAVFAPFN
jgi:hypothetical protein